MRRSKRPGPPGYVRLIGGDWRSRRLAIPPGADVRPTPDRVRETLFNWLGAHLPGAACVDLFAGTGALGFEALSRGAEVAWLVESDARLAAALREHAAVLGANARVVHERAEPWLARAQAGPFDVAFVDPPYALAIEPLASALVPRLAPHGLVYVERAATDPWPELPGFEWRRRGRAGDVAYGLAARAPG